ncbi:MAG: GGDEF domain-containing protein [Pseudomonadales bacterium]|nr:GGDEF domain-containing protein [Pseudomonadales bacterium]
MMLDDLLTGFLIAVGAFVMILAILRTRGILALIQDRQHTFYWKLLLYLMGFFCIGYVGVIVCLLVGYRDILLLFIGVIFFFGSLFVFLVVYSGHLTIEELVITTVSRDKLEKANADLLEARKQTMEATQLAYTDSLTQLANRRLISEFLKKVIASNLRHKEFAAVLLLDLDGFKEVNDTFGHEAGDMALLQIADRLRNLVRHEDAVGRLGGDEFVVLIDRLGPDEVIARSRATEMADRLISLVGEPIDYEGHPLKVGVSIGIRLLGFDEIEPRVALRDADVAMYSAKNRGKGQASFFDPTKNYGR